jgi:hypothetical protein
VKKPYLFLANVELASHRGREPDWERARPEENETGRERDRKRTRAEKTRLGGYQAGRIPGSTLSAGLDPIAGFVIFWDPEFRLLVFRAASLLQPAVAAVSVPLFHLFRDFLAGLDLLRRLPSLSATELPTVPLPGSTA